MHPITIAGGGLAGLTLGIGLRQKGIPVTVWEAGHYPRHRVCGEFISGRGQAVLARLGLRELFIQAGAIEAHSATFILGPARSPVRPLPAPALSLSRFEMDALLAKRFRESGGELREKERWREGGPREGVVCARGRRAQAHDRTWRWFGVKVHARNVPSVADLEMHSSLNGYVGITRLKDGESNVCGLFRRPAGVHSGGAAPGNKSAARYDKSSPPGLEILRGSPGTPLHERLAEAVFDESSFCSVAGLSLQAQHATDRAECCVGDALTMIPPVTGNGMSMAFEAAELAIEPLAAYSRGEIPWRQAQTTVARACDQTFARRLAWARWLQWLMFAPALQGGLGRVALNSGLLWRVMFAKTR